MSLPITSEEQTHEFREVCHESSELSIDVVMSAEGTHISTIFSYGLLRRHPPFFPANHKPGGEEVDEFFLMVPKNIRKHVWSSRSLVWVAKISHCPFACWVTNAYINLLLSWTPSPTLSMPPSFFQKRLPYVLMSSFWLQTPRGKKPCALFLPPLYSTHSIRKSRATGSWSLGVFGKVSKYIRHEKWSREVAMAPVKTLTRDWHEWCGLAWSFLQNGPWLLHARRLLHAPHIKSRDVAYHSLFTTPLSAPPK
jgi:hypothetical protein